MFRASQHTVTTKAVGTSVKKRYEWDSSGGDSTHRSVHSIAGACVSHIERQTVNNSTAINAETAIIPRLNKCRNTSAGFSRARAIRRGETHSAE